MAKFQGVLLEKPRKDEKQELAMFLAACVQEDQWFPHVNIAQLSEYFLIKLREFDATTGGREST